jgi:hypothetical protein
MAKEFPSSNDKATTRPSWSRGFSRWSLVPGHSLVIGHRFLVILWSVVIGQWSFLAAAEGQRTSTVGMPAKLEQLVLPGTELEVRPIDDRRFPIVLRIVDVYPHGTAFRYDLVYYGLDAGNFDLRDYLRRKDGSSTADLPPLQVKINPVLPPGQILPHALEPNRSPVLGGYRLLLAVAAVAWIGGLLAIIFLGRRNKRSQDVGLTQPVTLADRLRPLVENAMAGNLTPVEQAELERTLIVYWFKRLGLEKKKPAEAMHDLRQHEEAGQLLGQLEMWLHRPVAAEKVDITALLRPYQSTAAESLG